MSDSAAAPYVDSVFHPTDFSDASELAFAHALAIAVSRRTDFTMLHAGGKHDVSGEWKTFPPVRRTLERWGYHPSEALGKRPRRPGTSDSGSSGWTSDSR